jgi:hypothetical protein
VFAEVEGNKRGNRTHKRGNGANVVAGQTPCLRAPSSCFLVGISSLVVRATPPVDSVRAGQSHDVRAGRARSAAPASCVPGLADPLCSTDPTCLRHLSEYPVTMASGETTDGSGSCDSSPAEPADVAPAFGTLWVQRPLLDAGTATWADLYDRFGTPPSAETREALQRAVREVDDRFPAGGHAAPPAFPPDLR